MNSKLRIMSWKNFILFTITILLLASCSPQRRQNRLIDKHPELSRVDTIKIQDTVIVPGPKVDTVFSSSLLKDTVTITKDKLQIKLIEINDTVYLDAKVEADTVIFIKEITVEKVIYKELDNWWNKLFKKSWFWLAILFVVLLIFILLK